MDSRLQIFLFQKTDGPGDVGLRMTAPRREKDPVIQRLRSHLHRLDTACLQVVEVFSVDSAGARRNPDAVHPSVLEKGSGQVQQAPLFRSFHAGKGSAVEGDLRGALT